MCVIGGLWSKMSKAPDRSKDAAKFNNTARCYSKHFAARHVHSIEIAVKRRCHTGHSARPYEYDVLVINLFSDASTAGLPLCAAAAH